MKHETIPFPREFGPGTAGLDVKGVKRALKSWAIKHSNPKWKPGAKIDATEFFGAIAQETLSEFKGRHGLLHDPVYTLQAHQRLRPFFDELGASWMARKANSLAAQAMRDAYVKAWRWSVAHESIYDYAQVRPIPEGLAPFQTSQRIRTDCSGNTEIMAAWTPHCPDPSGLFFNGEGNTGSLLAHGKRIVQQQALPADLIVYRKGTWDGYGHHVVAILDVIGKHEDFQVGSHGHQGDPGLYRHSAMLASQAAMGYPTATFLRFLPAP